MEQEYKRAFSRLKASPEKIQEVIDMTENIRKPKRIIRHLLVAAAVVAFAALTAMGANAASGGKLFAQIVSYVEYEQDGEQVAKMEIQLDGEALEKGGVGEFKIVAGEDGKAYMTYTDENGKEVTQEINLEDYQNDTANEVQKQVESQLEKQK